jgi:hypothetical protein
LESFPDELDVEDNFNNIFGDQESASETPAPRQPFLDDDQDVPDFLR